MQDLIEQARSLGEAIAKHSTVQAFIAARRATEGDTTAQELLKEYAAAAQRVQQLEQTQQPIEPADKQRLAMAQQKMAGHDAVKELMRTQSDYAALMYRINEAMQKPLEAAGNAAQ